MSDRKVFTYRDAGVDLGVAGSLTARLAGLVESTRRPEVQGGFGSFGGRFRVSAESELVASADGVGTKVLVAVLAGVHDTVGEDLVNHCTNDILTEGAEPLFFLDYFACGRLDPNVAEAVVEGVARGCRRNGCALLGGETAEMPGVYRPGEYDLAGFIVGRRRFGIGGSEAVRAGDRLVALASNGLHTNGYSLARSLLFDRMGLGVQDPYPGTGESVGDVLLRVHRSYLHVLSEACEEGRVRALAHITGGGIPGNLRRILSPAVDAEVDVNSWVPGPEFRFLAEASGLPREDLYETLNMGAGMIAVVAPEDERAVREAVVAAGCEAFECGEVVSGSGAVRLLGA